MKIREIISAVFVSIGFLFILNSFSGITGFAVAESFGKNASSVLGFVFVVVGILGFLRENLEKSLRESVEKGIPLNEARKIFENANRKAESGEWVHLKEVNSCDASNLLKYPDSISTCEYWGSKKYLGTSKKGLFRLYKRGEIGKLHEITREGKVLHRHWEIQNMLDYSKNPRKRIH